MELFMKFLITTKKFLPALGLAFLLLLNIHSAQATSIINSSAVLTYTINSITSSGPGDLNGLEILDSYEILPHDPLYDIPDTLSIATISPYINTFSLASSLEAGSTGYFENAVIALNFLNNTDDTSYDIDVTLDYLLSADSSADVGTGFDQAETSVSLNWFNSDSSFSGADLTLSYANIAAQLGLVQTPGSSGVFSFTLAPRDVEVLFADVKIAGNLVATSVPEPSSMLLIAFALLALPGLNRIHNNQKLWLCLVPGLFLSRLL